MSKPRFAILYGVIACLSLTFVAGVLVRNSGPNADQRDVLAFLPEKIDTLVKISLGSPGEFKKDKGQWYVALAGDWLPARQDRIADLYQAIRTLPVAGVAATKPEQYATFGIDDAQAVKLSLAADKQEWQLYLASSPAGSAYLRLQGSDPVYALEYSLDTYRNQPVQYWADTAWLPGITAEDMREITVSGPGGTQVYQLGKAGDGSPEWKNAAGKRLEPADAETLKRNFTGAAIKEILPGLAPAPADKLFSITVRTAAGIGAGFTVFKEVEENSFLLVPGHEPKTLAGKPVCFRVTGWMFGKDILEGLWR